MDMSNIGGHCNITHIDEGSLKWLFDMGVKSLLDIGCSVGWQIEQALKIGIDAYGIDGDYSILNNNNVRCLERIFICDLSKSYVNMPIKFDAIWSVEVAEHIGEEYVDNYFKTIANNLKDGGILVFTHSLVSMKLHINVQSSSYWKEKLLKYNVIYSECKTVELKNASTMKREFIQQTGMVFIKQGDVKYD